MTKWTKRQSGGMRAVIRVRFDVPKEMVDGIMVNYSTSEAKALDFIRDHAAELIQMNTVAIDEDGELVVVHLDDLRYEHARWAKAWYDGPSLV